MFENRARRASRLARKTVYVFLARLSCAHLGLRGPPCWGGFWLRDYSRICEMIVTFIQDENIHFESGREMKSRWSRSNHFSCHPLWIAFSAGFVTVECACRVARSAPGGWSWLVRSVLCRLVCRKIGLDARQRGPPGTYRVSCVAGPFVVHAKHPNGRLLCQDAAVGQRTPVRAEKRGKTGNKRARASRTWT